jgi:hypothetical protein
MAMEMGMLVGLMSVAFIFSLVFSWIYFRYVDVWLAMPLTVLTLFFLQAALQTALQARVCGGVKSVGNIFWGALIGILPAAMIAVPAYIPSVAEIVSSVFVPGDVPTAYGTAYFGAFAGAMGIALGSLQSASCH